ncbi:MAG: sulfotransferase [Thermodesulfovibrionales bacterium]
MLKILRDNSEGPKAKNNFGFLIIGAGRGGTSLLAGILDYHTHLEVSIEKFAIEYLMGRKLPVQGRDMFYKRSETFVHACVHEAAAFQGRIFGNKITTEQLFGLEDHNSAFPDSKVDVINSFFNEYLKDQKIIFILRDGRTCVRSKITRTNQSVAQACDRWKYSVKVYRYLKGNSKKNICVKYEDLLLKTEETLKEICNFLEITYEINMLLGTKNRKMRTEYQQQNIDRSKVEVAGVPEGCIERIYDDLKYCGYI